MTAVMSVNSREVIVWTVESSNPDRQEARTVQVFGTEHHFPYGSTVLGTAMSAMSLVWHLVELL